MGVGDLGRSFASLQASDTLFRPWDSDTVSALRLGCKRFGLGALAHLEHAIDAVIGLYEAT